LGKVRAAGRRSKSFSACSQYWLSGAKVYPSWDDTAPKGGWLSGIICPIMKVGKTFVLTISAATELYIIPIDTHSGML
jgi:hypothetical protein